MIVARFQHISRVLHRWLGDHDVEFILVHAWSCDGESRMEKRMPAAMTALAHGPFLRCGGACAGHRGRWGGRRHDRGHVV